MQSGYVSPLGLHVVRNDQNSKQTQKWKYKQEKCKTKYARLEKIY